MEQINKRASASYWMALTLFSAVIIIHSTLSFPFPKTVGAIELIVGILLATYCLVSFNAATFLTKNGHLHFTWKAAAFFYFLTIPIIATIYNDWPLKNIIRDIVPLFFLLAPALAAEKRIQYEHMAFLCSLGGAALSIRYYLDAGVNLETLGNEFFSDSFLVYAYDPLVLFGAIFSFSRLFQGKLLTRLVHLGSCIACLVALFGVFQRGPIAMFFLSAAALSVFSGKFRFTPFRLVVVSAITLALVALYSDIFIKLFEGVLQKQLDNGLNRKDAEFFDIVDQLDTPLRALFGIGWGGIFYTSAYGGLYWNTHSAITYFLIKTGTIGLFFFLGYIRIFLLALFRLRKIDLGLSLACAMPLLVGLLFQPTYKTLTYWLIFVVAFAASNHYKFSNAQEVQ